MRINVITSIFLILSLSTCKDSTSNTEPCFTNGVIMEDEFDGNDWNRDNWYPELEIADGGITNGKTTPYDRNIEVSDGTLKIHALLDGNGQRRGDYSSARMLTYETFLYGRMEIRAKMPEHKGNGLWPAIWMLGIVSEMANPGQIVVKLTSWSM